MEYTTDGKTVEKHRNWWVWISAGLGTTQADLSQTEQDLKDAQTDVDKANAEAKHAKAEAQAAEAKNSIVKDCANAYLTEVGSLLESEDPSAQAETAKTELQGITADCRAALEGS